MRLDGSIHINPTTAAKHLQADFDGDRLAYELADKYPVLAEEIRQKLTPQQRYPDVVKRDKVPYQGSFEEIAIQCASNDIGTIANQIMRSVAIYNDTLARPPTEQPEWVLKAASHYQKQLSQVRQGQLDLPQEYLDPIRQIAKLAPKSNLTPQDINTALDNIRTIERLAVSDLANELQVAVDGPKSAARPDLKLVRSCQLASNCLEVAFIGEKSNREVFNTRPAHTSTYSPIDTLLTEVNQSFEQVRLEPRPAHTFRSLHPEPSQEALALAKEIKEAYNDKLALAMQMKRTLEEDPEKGKPFALFRSSAGQPIALTRLDYFDSQKLLENSSSWEISLIPKPESVKLPNPLLVQATIEGEPRIIGAVSIHDTNKQSLQPSSSYTTPVSLKPAITEARIEAAWRDLDSYANMLQREHTPQEKKDLAAALWYQSHARNDYGNQKALVAFRVFPDEALEPLKTVRFQELSIIGLQYSPDRELVERLKSGKEVTCEVVDQEITTKKGTSIRRGIAAEGTFLGTMQSQSPSYPVATIFKASVEVAPPAYVNATLPDGTHLTIKNVRQYAYQNHTFRGDTTPISLRPATPPDPNRKGQHPLAFVDNLPLGFLDRESEKVGQKKGIWAGKPTNMTAQLSSPPSNSATLHLAPDSIVPPWQHRERSLDPATLPDIERDAARERLKLAYDSYAGRVREQNPALVGGEPLDREVARLATSDGLSRHDTAALLSASPTITQYRPDPNSPEWDTYEVMAKDYVARVTDAAIALGERPRQICLER